MIDSKPLKVLSASAGSGKTYNLVLSFLRLVLAENAPFDAFAHIIAMTFTNKAAAEMKSRIIDALNLLSSVDEGNEKAKSYQQTISKELNLPLEKIQEKAALVLSSILHHYEQFHILTIDKFNLRLLRSFARDLNINSDFQTTTNEKEVLAKLVDQVFSEINLHGVDHMTSVALQLSRERFEEEQRWDFKSELNEFVQILTKEQNIPVLRIISEGDYGLQRYKELKLELHQLKTALQHAGDRLYKILKDEADEHFVGKSRTTGAFKKLKSVFREAKAENECFFTKSAYTAILDSKSPQQGLIQQALEEFVAFYKKNIVKIKKLDLYLKNYFFIALLKSIVTAFDSFKKIENVVMISEFNLLISNLLKNESAPYIYERIGNRYSNFLLDEFQDTSRLQWVNLIPLVHESLSKQQANLIVGDPKQSIYRFKNGLAEQFVALPEIYNPENDESLRESSSFFKQMGESLPLKENWRSKEEVVQFNNAFFNELKEASSATLKSFYEDVEQIPRGTAGGFVYIDSEVLESKKKAAASEEEPEEEQEDTAEFDFLLKWVEQALEDGYQAGDICILDYKREPCNAYASFLMQRGYKVVSGDSLLLSSNKSVGLLVLYFSYRNAPSSEIAAKKFMEAYLDYHGKETMALIQTYWKKVDLGERIITVIDEKRFIQEFFGGEATFFCHYESMYQLAQKAYLLLGIDELESAFVHQFSDFCFQFDQTFGPSLSAFLDHFERQGNKTSVSLPEGKDSIKLMTVHKSKGLEFPVVLIPSLKWPILNAQSTFLLADEDFVYYTTLSKSSFIPAVKALYEQEYDAALLDKINLLYVALTRAKDRLYVRNRAVNTNTFGKLFHAILGTLRQDESVRINYQLGERKAVISEEQQKEELEFFPARISDNLWFPEIALQDTMLTDENPLSEERRFGKQLHELLSRISSADQIEKELEKATLEGKVEALFKEELKSKLAIIFADVQYLSLFDDAQEVLKEQDILIDATEIKRPDIIIRKANETLVIDYKSGQEQNKYAKQLTTYATVLKNMGLPEVKAYIYYTTPQKLVQIV